MPTESVFDAAASRKLEAAYLTPDAVERRRATRHALALRPGERVLDVGPTPGLLVAEMAQAVGPAGHVTGLDISDAMLALGQRRCVDLTGAGRASFIKAHATALPFADATFDVAVSTQVYEYVADLPTALVELHRVLRLGGRVLILDTDWDSIVWHATDTEQMGRLLAAWIERFADPYLPRTLARQLRDAGFQVDRRDVLVPSTPSTTPTPTASPMASSWPTSPSPRVGSHATRSMPGPRTSIGSGRKRGTSSASTVTCSSPTGDRNQHRAWGRPRAASRVSLDLPLRPGWSDLAGRWWHARPPAASA